jgi:acetylornithine deacetylase/succinyl-diaminopimelate desuccinylase-like protein
LRESAAARKQLAGGNGFCSDRDVEKETRMKNWTALLGSALLATTPAAAQDAPRADQLAFRDLYKELVETNTTLSSGSCTLAAERMAARMKAAGFPDSRLTLFATPDHPKEGGLVAIYPGTSKTAKPILLIAHIDVVEAKREDWERDPFRMVEENGYFYGRGTLDDKAQAAVWVDALIRFQKEGYKPKRAYLRRRDQRRVQRRRMARREQA